MFPLESTPPSRDFGAATRCPRLAGVGRDAPAGSKGCSLAVIRPCSPTLTGPCLCLWFLVTASSDFILLRPHWTLSGCARFGEFSVIISSTVFFLHSSFLSVWDPVLGCQASWCALSPGSCPDVLQDGHFVLTVLSPQTLLCTVSIQPSSRQSNIFISCVGFFLVLELGLLDAFCCSAENFRFQSAPCVPLTLWRAAKVWIFTGTVC